MCVILNRKSFFLGCKIGGICRGTKRGFGMKISNYSFMSFLLPANFGMVPLSVSNGVHTSTRRALSADQRKADSLTSISGRVD